MPGEHEERLEAPQSCGVSPFLLVSSHAPLCAPAVSSSTALTSPWHGESKQGDGFGEGVWPSTCLTLPPWALEGRGEEQGSGQRSLFPLRARCPPVSTHTHTTRKLCYSSANGIGTA